MSVVSQPPVPTNSSKAVVTALLNLKPKKRAANPRVGADFEALRTFINDRVEQRSGKKRIQKGQVDPTELDTDPIIPNDMLMENMYSTKQIQQSKFEPLFQHTRYVESLSDINRSERPKTQEFCLTHRSEYRRQHNSASPTHKYLSRPNTSRHTQKAGSPPSFSSTKISRAQQNTPPLMVPALFTASPPKHGRTQPLIESARSFNKEHFDRGTAILKQNELRREEALQARLKKGQSYFEAEQAFLNDKPDFVSKTDQQPFAPAAHASPYAPSNMPLSYAYHRPHPSARKRAATNTNTDPVSVPKERFNKQVVMRWVLLMKCAAYVGAVQNAFEEDRAKRTIKLTLARQFRNELRELKERRKTEQRRDALIKAGVIGRTLGQVGLRLQTLQMNRFAENLRVFLFDVRANMMLRVRLLQFRQCIIEAQRLERSRRQCRNARLLIFDTLWSSTEAFLLRGGQDPTDFVPSTMLYPSSYKQQKIKQSDTIEEQLAFLNSIDLPKPPVEETVAPHKTLHVEYDLSALLSKTDAQSREAEILLPFQTAIQKGRQKFSSTKSTSAQTNGGKSRPLPALSRGISSSTLRTLDSGDSNDAPEQEAPPQTFVLHSNDSMLRLLAPSVGPKLSSPSIVMDTPTSKVNSPSLTPSSSKALLRSRSHASLKNPKSIQSRKSLVTNPNFTQPSSQSQFSSYVPKPIRYSIMTRRMNLIRKHHLLHVEKGDFFVPYFGLMKKIMIDMVLEGMETTLNQSVVPS
ncbi:hypothetical protein BLNAU_2714 [Blattamonas nauphoetae]|uniref:Uncharacterized protein n=1 Tax=Blattamonas nauphoetae TaxID=2049346 RepID=A0ABQ9YFC2_9EUKA|nr:hypothetical protein BLNAU_2714 [Blattamonas nauphoetae]